MRKVYGLFVGLFLIVSCGVAHAENGSGSASVAGASSGSNAGAQANLYTGNNTSIYPQNTPAPTAPAFVTASPCMGTVSGAGSSPIVAIAIGMSYKDGECEKRSNAAELSSFGLRNASIQELCQIDTVAAALEKAGTPCSSFSSSNNVASASAIVTQPATELPAATPPMVTASTGSPQGQKIYRPEFCDKNYGNANWRNMDESDKATYDYYCKN